MCVVSIRRLISFMTAFIILSFVLLCVSCNTRKTDVLVDALNDSAYHYHYISLDSTLLFATRALERADEYDAGHMEALNNLAFVDIMKMKFDEAENHLKQIINSTDNQFELLVANVQMMRLCQRRSKNKNFYDYYWQARNLIQRIEEDKDILTERQQYRLTYAKTELSIILAAYLYYVGQNEASKEALSLIKDNADLQRDTTLLLNYYYNIGSGGFIDNDTPERIAQKEFDYLTRCYFLAKTSRNVFWEAEALQAISEHLQDEYLRDMLISSNVAVMKYLNFDNVADSLLSGNIAQRSVDLFSEYGDIYQTAGALRTLSDSYFDIGRYDYAIICLNEALDRDTAVNQAPSLISSLHEKLSINHAAIDDKKRADYHRNFYLDLQENTRQDRELEARAEQSDRLSFIQNLMMLCVCLAIGFVILLLYLFTRMRRRDVDRFSVDSMLEPLRRWEQQEIEVTEKIISHYEEIIEEQNTAELLLERNLQNNLEQRAKMSLVNSIRPFIDRMLAEIRFLMIRNESEDIIQARYSYIRELTDMINEYNAVLTNWIQLRRGELSMKIESFRLQELFDIVRKSRLSFDMKGVELIVKDTKAFVKADRTLTLFMINTIADNARKATEKGGEVIISAIDTNDYVEISVSDTGKGMDEQELKTIFTHQPSFVASVDDAENQSNIKDLKPQHGFGLMNCKGIIEKYKKISHVFSVCSISASSEKGKGTIFKFRLPHGVLRVCIVLMSFFCSSQVDANENKIQMFTDSVYFCNLQGRYENALSFADSARTYLNIHYRKLRPYGNDLMVTSGVSADNAAELKWFSDSLKFNYPNIIDLRNETAVAALALHKWDVYNYNNKVYFRLFREYSADPSLLIYVKKMKQSNETKDVALILLSLLFMCILPAYYILYYRHKVYYRFLLDKINAINAVLFDNITEEEKLSDIKAIWYQGNSFLFDNKESAALTGVVEQICRALDSNINIRKANKENIDIAEDELHRLNYEIERLHVNNNVLDNCFSTLKHETMYYPSRIRQLIDDPEKNIIVLNEITTYYKELYSILSMQGLNQVETNVKIDDNIIHYLLTLIRKLSGEKVLSLKNNNSSKDYMQYKIEMPNLKLTREQTHNLFTPSTHDLSCLVIRQIVREIGETTNQRGCGVLAMHRDDGGIDVILTLSKKIKINTQ